MNPLFLGPLLDIGGKLIDRLFPDPVEREKANLELLKMAQSGDLAQIEVNKVEAAHQSIFVAGWRPGAGWCCVIGLGYTFLLRPALSWLAQIQGWPIPPAIDVDALLVLLGGMLGLGGLRTVEKVKGKA